VGEYLLSDCDSYSYLTAIKAEKISVQSIGGAPEVLVMMRRLDIKAFSG
jgi:hypothetical protein